MPRLTPIAWWCRCNQRNQPSDRQCVRCGQSKIERHAQVHASERAVVYYNPATGEHRTPARADTPMPARYAESGFERREILSMSDWEHEAGVVHEASNFHPGNEPPPPDPYSPPRNPDAIRAITEDVRDAIASGPFTGGI